MIKLHTEAEIKKIRACGFLVAEVLRELKGLVSPGITSAELDRRAEGLLLARGVRPAFKGYRGYPNTLCTSVNDGIVHGIPGPRRLQAGDIISLDLGGELDGYYSDAALTVPVGEIPADVQNLLRVTEESLYLGIEQARCGGRLSDISHAVQTHVERHGYSVVKAFVGHGIGRQLQEDPQIPNYGLPGRGVRLKAGMVLAIEPMGNMGGDGVNLLADGWTAVTMDGSLSAHFEHTVALTVDGPEIITKC